MKIQFILDLYNEHLAEVFEMTMSEFLPNVALISDKHVYSDIHKFYYTLKAKNALDFLQAGIIIGGIQNKDEKLHEIKKIID